ncbi:hypothetical protein P280DRAFT_49580 [Massarina eburnea CBS 473.64]|uniref:DC-UbP/UBTD2 N-terminal domain-containing protein n=1 Tax=Massarina eburnea CBS 473.64 TaxID=1395130 RepID=A0A6A6RXT0_9PLEO|nr:hypothetical protein P280DRAFT_49580 [Massarina eburnea CBS 473.64]
MGCCASRQAGDDSPYPPVSTNHAPDASSRNITASSPPRSASLASPRASHSQPTTEHRPNLPLKPIDPTQRARLPTNLPSGPHRSNSLTQHDGGGSGQMLWTRSQLEKERNDWWDTRTTGREEIWRALRLMVESLQSGDIAEAQALLDATECTCPNGMLWKGVFDGRGEWYRIQEWIVVEPEAVIEDEDDVKEVNEEDGEGVVGTARRGGKGKGVEVLGDPVKVKCRLSTTGRDYVVSIHKGEKARELVAKLKKKAGINLYDSVRIVYGGQIIPDNEPLDSHPYWNYENRHVLIAMIFESSTSPSLFQPLS